MRKFNWVITDPSCNQKMLCVVPKQVYTFSEDRTNNPITGSKYIFIETLNYKDYTKEELLSACKPFGYTVEQVSGWIKDNKNISLMLECIFEQL